jgi:hypothetical protein
MKNLLFLILPALFFLSCSDDDARTAVQPISMVGEWQVTSSYTDPGDGSGSFQPVTNGKTIVINEDGTWFCNVSICFGSLTAATTNGTYTATEFISTDCEVNYTFIDGVFEFQHSCIEPCLERLTRVP